MSHGITDDDLEMIRESLASDTTFAEKHAKHKANTPEETPPAKCQEWREKALDGQSSYDLARATNYTRSIVRKHLRGDCSHTDGEIGPLTYHGEWQHSDGEWIKDG